MQRLGIDGALRRTLKTTNPIENMNGAVACHTRNVKRWRDGQMLLRWVGPLCTKRNVDSDASEVIEIYASCAPRSIAVANPMS